METTYVTSKDGTKIAYTKQGSGPAVILVDGALTYRQMGPNGALAKELARDFTVYTYDRRGRGESPETQPWSYQREIEDLDALIDLAGGEALLYGISSGGALALEATRQLGKKVKKLAVFEIPFVVDDSRPPVPDDYLEHMQQLVAENKRGAVIKYFMTKGVNLPPMMVALFPVLPGWPKMKAIAHTLPYDVAMVVDYEHGKPLPPKQWASITQPVLVIDGGKSPQPMRNAMHALADVLHSEYKTLPGQTHIVKAAAIGPVIATFFKQ